MSKDLIALSNRNKNIEVKLRNKKKMRKWSKRKQRKNAKRKKKMMIAARKNKVDKCPIEAKTIQKHCRKIAQCCTIVNELVLIEFCFIFLFDQ
jgi:hypothetical protein